jgi:hypothetical protein
MSPVTGQCIGIDISEQFLDVYVHPVGKEVRFPHSDEGIASLLALLRDYPVERVVLESTGGRPGRQGAASRRAWRSRHLGPSGQ